MPLKSARQMVIYEQGGAEARQTLIFIHGTPASSAAFIEQMRHPFVGSCLVAIDRLGFGASSGGPNEACLRGQAESVVELIDRRQYKRVILIGHSYGAPVALQAALLHPEIKGVVSLGGCFDPAYERPWPLQYLGKWPFVAWSIPRVIRQCNMELLGLKRELADLIVSLSQLSCPVLMLHGGEDDRVPVGNVAYLEKKLQEVAKGALFSQKTYADGNHFIPWLIPGEINGQIEQFVKRHAP